MKWINSFSTGIPVMDDDHKTLINIIKLLRMVLHDGAPVAADALASVLADHLDEHFRREEGLIARTGFSGLAEHRLVHGDSATGLLHLRAAIAKRQFDAALEALGELECWMIGEIVEADLSFASFAEYYEHGECMVGFPRLSSTAVI